MKYRKLTENGDYAFGRGGADMHADTPEAVGQAVLTRLRLFAGEWFVDLKEGTPYVPGVLGKHTQERFSNGARHHRRNRAAPARLSHGP